MITVKLRVRILAFCSLALVLGCGHRPPPLAEVEGILLLDGQPLPSAHVEFVPELAHFGAEMNSTATTDESGKFRLLCNKQAKPGAVVAKHWVVVTEVALPEQRRERERETPNNLDLPLAALANRPIPAEYGSVGTTPLRVDVTRAAQSYTLQMSRKS
jgi:hypothetical protein